MIYLIFELNKKPFDIYTGLGLKLTEFSYFSKILSGIRNGHLSHLLHFIIHWLLELKYPFSETAWQLCDTCLISLKNFILVDHCTTNGIRKSKVLRCASFVPLYRSLWFIIPCFDKSLIIYLSNLSFSFSVIVEALKLDSLQKLCSSLEPILRRVVS